MESEPSQPPDGPSPLAQVTAGISLSLLLVFSVWLFSATKDTIQDQAKSHFLMVVGFPICCMVSLIVVGLFRATSGPIEFKAMGMEFKGASGPVILWVVVLLACVGGSVALWSAK